MKHKQPNKLSRFALAIIPSEKGLTYRLSRRDFRNVLHFAFRTFAHGTDHAEMARSLWAMRRELNDRVDGIELELLGLTQ